MIQLDDNGIVKNDVTGDGWKAIKEFRDLVKKYKIEALTVVALAVDYDSILAYYNDNDRYLRAVEEVYGVRDKLKKDSLVDAALKKYDALQYNDDLEHDRIIREYKSRLLERLKAAMADESEKGERDVERLNKTLKNHEETNKEFYKKFDRNEVIYSNAVTSSGYSLSRIENDLLTKKNSKFANEGRDLINPKKLGISE